MPCAMHLLPMAAGDAGASLSRAEPRERLRRSGGDEVEVPEDEGTVFRRRHVHCGPGARAQNRAVAEAAGDHVVDQLARQRRLRNAEDHEGRRAQAVRGRLRVRQRADFEKYQEGRRDRSRAALLQGLPRARHPDSRHFHPGTAGRKQGVDGGIDPVRARDGLRDDPGIARVALPRHGAVRLRDQNGFLAVDPLLDESGYQKCTITYPGLTNEEIYGAVERFYRSFYFRPKYIFKSVKKMMTSMEETKRMLNEGRQFLSTMRQRRHQTAQQASA